jgi:hypothetical protein
LSSKGLSGAGTGQRRFWAAAFRSSRINAPITNLAGFFLYEQGRFCDTQLDHLCSRFALHVRGEALSPSTPEFKLPPILGDQHPNNRRQLFISSYQSLTDLVQ